MKAKTLLLSSAVLSAMMLTGCATTGAKQKAVATEDGVRQVPVTTIKSAVWDKTGTTFNTPGLKQNESAIVLLRADNNPDFQTSANITFDKDFHGSLQSGQYLVLKTCAGDHVLGGEITGAKTNNLEIPSYRLKTEANTVQFIAVTVDPNTNQTMLQPVDKNAALKHLPNMKEQTHLVSRVAPKSCAAPVVKVVEKKVEVQKPAAPKSFTLSSDFLFDFNKEALKPYASGEIDKLVMQIKGEYATINAVTVVGHTDHLGSAEYNQNLAQKRAETVKSELAKRGFNPNIIQTVSMGESQPVTDGCHGMSREQAKSCLAPDRRVEVKVSGDLK